MAFPDSLTPVVDGIQYNPYYIQADDSSSSTNAIPWNQRVIVVSAVTNDGNDYVELPLIADVPAGHKITILNKASSVFRLRTPASSDTKINNVDSDGTQETECFDGQVMTVLKVSNTQGWLVFALTNLGATATAMVPVTTSVSSSASKSPSASMSPSSSASSSMSPSASKSPSSSSSASKSPSASLSPSSSSSLSQSPSASLSPSSSASSSSSASKSPSASLSPSSSASSSSSASLSPSSSVSRSQSPSSSASA